MQNKKRYWLTGGIIAVILLGLVTLALVILFPSQPSLGAPISAVPVLLGMVLWDLITNFTHINTNFIWTSTSGSNLMILISSVTYFLVGSLFGWLYGKIKNRNKTI